MRKGGLTMRDAVAAEALRFERFPSVDVLLGSKCSCWSRTGGPFVHHPAGCLCICHGRNPQHG
jgi:hypothetical protein